MSKEYWDYKLNQDTNDNSMSKILHKGNKPKWFACQKIPTMQTDTKGKDKNNRARVQGKKELSNEVFLAQWLESWPRFPLSRE